MTINVNRLVQDAIWDMPLEDVREAMTEQVQKVHKYLTAFNEILKERQKAGLLPVYDAGFISLDKQYLTIGVNGLLEGAELLDILIEPDHPDYIAYVEAVLGPIYEANRAARTKELMFNTELVPAEGLGVKNAKWDKAGQLFVPRDCYNSYFYVVEDTNTDPIEKFRLHGRKYIEHLTGGSALHMNLDEHLSQQQYRQLLRVAAKEGCNYFTFNIPNTLCKECGHIDKRYLKECPHCKSQNVDYLTRVIGYLKRVSNFSLDRQKEAARRYYAHAEVR